MGVEQLLTSQERPCSMYLDFSLISTLPSVTHLLCFGIGSVFQLMNKVWLQELCLCAALRNASLVTEFTNETLYTIIFSEVKFCFHCDLCDLLISEA
jgi:hypothetical protein